MVILTIPAGRTERIHNISRERDPFGLGRNEVWNDAGKRDNDAVYGTPDPGGTRCRNLDGGTGQQSKEGIGGLSCQRRIHLYA